MAHFHSSYLALVLFPLSVNAQYSGGIGHGDGVALFQNTPLAPNIALGGVGHGDIAALFQPTPLSPNIALGGIGHGDVAAFFQSTPISPNIALGGDGRGDVGASFDASNVRLALKAYLEGPYNVNNGEMTDHLRALGLVPTTEPYTALGYSHVGGGGESVTPAVLALTGSSSVVDWVVVELRNAATPTQVLATRSALIQSDGDIVAADGTSPLIFAVPPMDYKVALRHRNHLGVMALNSISLLNYATSLDLSSPSTALFGTNARKSVTGTFPAQALWAGDVTFNGQLKYTGAANDRDPILVTVGSTTPNNTVNLYSTRDVNMDGVVKYTGSANDRDPILVNVGSTTPNNVKVQQLP